jgi:hypothetical protein
VIPAAQKHWLIATGQSAEEEKSLPHCIQQGTATSVDGDLAKPP